VAVKHKPGSVSSEAKNRELVLRHINELIAAGLAIRFRDDRRVGLLTGELYVLTEDGVLRLK
jgi:hypothetical protein